MLAELIARIHTLLRQAAPSGAGRVMLCGGIIMDMRARRVYRNGRKINLAPVEHRLLHQLMNNPERVFSCARARERSIRRDNHDGDRAAHEIDARAAATAHADTASVARASEDPHDARLRGGVEVRPGLVDDEAVLRKRPCTGVDDTPTGLTPCGRRQRLGRQSDSAGQRDRADEDGAHPGGQRSCQER